MINIFFLIYWEISTHPSLRVIVINKLIQLTIVIILKQYIFIYTIFIKVIVNLIHV